MEKVTIIIPCYDEQDSLLIFYQEISTAFRQIGCDYELLFINDGSKDNTLPILKELSEKDIHVTYLSFSRNFGREAIMTVLQPDG